ncbi:hypothetical protein FNYG_15206 [Fusarium nygamai]|uniref:Uncharacterized protein n=1 Tax=Gibberella nygamai TaxID=42673 RepID=A0A2K0UIZ4_GIBNY|nr:hypothetical protein FNYG_15206 [Fusarium nygamai]
MRDRGGRCDDEHHDQQPWRSRSILSSIIKSWRGGRARHWPSFNDGVHGVVDIIELDKYGYAVVYVSTTAEFEPPDFESYEPPSMPGKKGVQIALNYNATKILISLGQTLYSVFTLYRTRGDQVARYGYAAFGLTVAPFAVMSTVNLLGNLIVPTYPKMYLVESAGLRKAREEGIYIDGVVGRLVETEKEKEDFCLDHRKTIAALDFSRKPTIWQYAACTVVSTIPLLINYGISGLESRSSSLAARVWMLLWLASCIAFATFYTTLEALQMAQATHSLWRSEDGLDGTAEPKLSQ